MECRTASPVGRRIAGSMADDLAYKHERNRQGFLFCHATPQNPNDVFTRLTPDDKLVSMIGEMDADVLVCGHTHMQFNRMIGGLRVVNAGSVGMPFGDPGAYWLLLGPDVEFHRTEYDLEMAATRIRQTHYPEAQQFAANHVLFPLSEQKMLAGFHAM